MSDFEVTKTGETAKLKKLVIQGLEVVEDFMPNIGRCALQDYGKLNEFTIEADKVRREENGS